jgi:hypothetical protein
VRIDRIVWDLENDPRGNVQHIAQNGVTMEEEVLFGAAEFSGTSASSGFPFVVGTASSGKDLVIVVAIVEEEPLAVRPITAYEIEF